MAAPEQGGNILTRKMGPLPIWAWAGIALVAVYLYRRYSGAASAATTTTAASTTQPTETLQTAGGTYTGPVGGAPGAVTNPSSTAPGTGGTSPGNGGGTPGQAVTTTSGSFVMPAAGQPFYWELTPAGAAEYQASTGNTWQYGAQPSSVPVPTKGAYTWQVVPAPSS